MKVEIRRSDFDEYLSKFNTKNVSVDSFAGGYDKNITITVSPISTLLNNFFESISIPTLGEKLELRTEVNAYKNNELVERRFFGICEVYVFDLDHLNGILDLVKKSVEELDAKIENFKKNLSGISLKT